MRAKGKIISFIITFIAVMWLSVMINNQVFAEESISINGKQYSALVNDTSNVPEDLIAIDQRNTTTIEENGKTYLVDLSLNKIDGLVYKPSEQSSIYYDGNGTWYYYKNGAVDTTFNGLINTTDDNYYYVNGGHIDFTYSGVQEYNGKYYQIVNGKRTAEVVDGLNEINGNL